MSITRALDSLGIINFRLEGNPKTEEEFNIKFVKITGVDSDSVAIESTDPQDFGITWDQLQTAISNLDNQDLVDLRTERNILIAQTDWSQFPDVPEETRTLWQPYRQALRDITDTYTSLSDVVWPEKPGT
jgi:hypothetical protein|tara:strand:+ start:149 stop:538 length:390 start_codon:yes stop_codon:yes gene_type:complete